MFHSGSSNNSAAAACIQKQGGMVYINLAVPTKTEYNIIVHVRAIPGSLNVIVDSLSRKNQFFPKSFVPKNFYQLTSIVGKLGYICLLRNSYVSHVSDQRTYSAYALATHWGGTICTATQYINHNSVRRLHSTVNSLIFPSSSVVPNFLKPVNRDTS